MFPFFFYCWQEQLVVIILKQNLYFRKNLKSRGDQSDNQKESQDIKEKSKSRRQKRPYRRH